MKPKSNPFTSLPSALSKVGPIAGLATLVCPLTLALPAPAQSARQSLASTNPSGPTAPLAVQTNWILVEDQGLAPLESYQVGLGGRLDRTTGDFLPCKPIFYLTTPLVEPSTPTSGHLEFVLNFGDRRVQKSNSLHADVAGTIGVVKVAAAHTQDQSSGSTGMDASCSLLYTQDWSAAMVTAGQMTLTPLAQQVLAITDPIARSAAWREYFGEYVAVGIGYRGHIGVKMSLGDHSSYQTMSSFSSLSVQYSTASADVDIARMAFDCRRSQDVNLAIDYMGDRRLHIDLPTAGELDTPAKQLAWVAALKAQADGSKRRIGLWMSPATSWWDLPYLDQPQFDDITLNSTTLAATNAMELLVRAESYSKSVGQRLFLAQRFPAGSLDSYDTILQENVGAMLARLDDLWAALAAYLGEGHQTPQYELQLGAATSAVNTARAGLDQALTNVTNLVQGLPLMTSSATEYFVTGPDLGTYARYQMIVDVHNAAIFSNGSTEPVRQWLESCKDDESLNPIVVNMLRGDGQWEALTSCDYLPPPHDLHYIEGVSIDSMEPETAPASAGLMHLRLRFRVALWQNAHQVSVTFHDMLGRPVTWGPYDLAGGASHP